MLKKYNKENSKKVAVTQSKKNIWIEFLKFIKIDCNLKFSKWNKAMILWFDWKKSCIYIIKKWFIQYVSKKKKQNDTTNSS